MDIEHFSPFHVSRCNHLCKGCSLSIEEIWGTQYLTEVETLNSLSTSLQFLVCKDRRIVRPVKEGYKVSTQISNVQSFLCLCDCTDWRNDTTSGICHISQYLALWWHLQMHGHVYLALSLSLSLWCLLAFPDRDPFTNTWLCFVHNTQTCTISTPWSAATIAIAQAGLGVRGVSELML